ncbi:hypothetical protein D3C76_709940 [compost metagenome]
MPGTVSYATKGVDHSSGTFAERQAQTESERIRPPAGWRRPAMPSVSAAPAPWVPLSRSPAGGIRHRGTDRRSCSSPRQVTSVGKPARHPGDFARENMASGQRKHRTPERSEERTGQDAWQSALRKWHLQSIKKSNTQVQADFHPPTTLGSRKATGDRPSRHPDGVVACGGTPTYSGFLKHGQVVRI